MSLLSVTRANAGAQTQSCSIALRLDPRVRGDDEKAPNDETADRGDYAAFNVSSPFFQLQGHSSSV